MIDFEVFMVAHYLWFYECSWINLTDSSRLIFIYRLVLLLLLLYLLFNVMFIFSFITDLLGSCVSDMFVAVLRHTFFRNFVTLASFHGDFHDYWSFQLNVY